MRNQDSRGEIDLQGKPGMLLKMKFKKKKKKYQEQEKKTDQKLYDFLSYKQFFLIYSKYC